MVSAVSPALGKLAGGARVTVTGSGFTKAKKVLFGKKAGKKLKVLSDTQLSVVAPSGKAGSVDIRVVAKAGTSAKVAVDKFRYVAAPKITKLSSASGATVGGTTITITGSSFVGVSKCCSAQRPVPVWRSSRRDRGKFATRVCPTAGHKWSDEF